MTITSISLDRLKVSPHNVRKTHDKKSLEELKASLLAHGLLQPPLVTMADDGHYEVVDGARRLAALEALHKDGKLPEDYLVSCELAGDGDASELSLAANVVRNAMHPADEYEAFAALTKDHKPSEIAKRFGVPEKHVLQRLKLGTLAPEILKAYRDEKLNLEALMAYTLTDDHNAQRKVFKAQNGYHQAYSIKRLLTESKARSDSKLAKFVGAAAYEKAGGKVTGDLFGEEKYFDDAALVQSLAHQKLSAQAEKLKAEGWGWTQTALESDYGFVSSCGHVHPKPKEVPKKLSDKLKKLQAEYEKADRECDALDDEDPKSDAAYEKCNALQQQVEDTEAEIEEYSSFDPEDMKLAGCYLVIGHDGKVSVTAGLVKPGDKKAAKKSAQDSGEAEPAKPKEKGFSQSLIDSVKQHRLQISQAALAADPGVALDLLIFKAGCDKFTSSYIHTGPEVSFSRNHFRSDMVPDAKNTVAGKQLAAIHERLKLDWLKEKTESSKFEAFREISLAQKLEILAYCTASTLHPQLAQKNAFEAALGATEADVSQYWRPTTDYLGRLTREQLFDVGRQIFSKEWATKWAGAKKGDLVKELDRAFVDPKKFSGNKETEEKLRTWLPEGMAFTLPEKKAAKAKKKAA